MRLIDADALMKVIRTYDYPLKSHFNSTDNGMFTIGIQQVVDEQPTVDLVERIEYEKMKDLIEEYKFEYECMFESLKEVLNEVLPKRVEVVRCENCKHYDEQAWDRNGRGRCKSQNIFMFPNDFCSYGERREESEVEHAPDCPFCVRYGTDECLKNECKHLKSYKESEVEE